MATKTEQRLIHIHAQCDFFEIFEIKPENIAVKRLEAIRKMYLDESARKGYLKRRSARMTKLGFKDTVEEGRLIVKTGVHNPTLFVQ